MSCAGGTNDVEKLVEMFWKGELVMRIGLAANLYDQAVLEAFANQGKQVSLARGTTRVDMVRSGRDFANIALEFERVRNAGRRVGRAKPGLGEAD